MKKLYSVLLLTALATGAMAMNGSDSFAKGRAPSRHTVVVRKHKRAPKNVTPTSFEARRKCGKRCKKSNPGPKPAQIG